MKKFFDKFSQGLDILVYFLIACAAVVYLTPFVVNLFPQDSLGANHQSDNTVNIVGSSTNLVSVPPEPSFSSSTTTDASVPAGSGGVFTGVADGGFTLNQEISTRGVSDVILNIQMLSGTVTSTLYIRQLGSFDGTTFFNIASSTANFGSSTTTVLMGTPKAIDVLDYTGNSTTSTVGLSIPLSTYGFNVTRFLIHDDDLTSDPTDGVQAWISATLVEGIVR